MLLLLKKLSRQAFDRRKNHYVLLPTKGMGRVAPDWKSKFVKAVENDFLIICGFPIVKQYP